MARVPLSMPDKPNQHWSMGFMSDCLYNGHRFRGLTIIDNFSRECMAIKVDTSINGLRVTGVLNRLAWLQGLPESISVDNDPEFAGKALDVWVYERGVKINFIRPGKPIDNAYIERFNGTSYNECLNDHWFMSLAHARKVIEEWRIDYN